MLKLCSAARAGLAARGGAGGARGGGALAEAGSLFTAPAARRESARTVGSADSKTLRCLLRSVTECAVTSDSMESKKFAKPLADTR